MWDEGTNKCIQLHAVLNCFFTSVFSAMRLKPFLLHSATQICRFKLSGWHHRCNERSKFQMFSCLGRIRWRNEPKVIWWERIAHPKFFCVERKKNEHKNRKSTCVCSVFCLPKSDSNVIQWEAGLVTSMAPSVSNRKVLGVTLSLRTVSTYTTFSVVSQKNQQNSQE